MYMKDRNRVEVCLPAQMMLACALAGISPENQEKEDFKTFKADLIEASAEVMDDLLPNKRASLLRRVLEVHETLAKEFLKDDYDDIPKLALTQFHCLRFIIEDGYLQYDPDSPLGRSIPTFMDAIDHHAAEPKLNASAIKQARKMLTRLQSMGYYPGVETGD